MVIPLQLEIQRPDRMRFVCVNALLEAEKNFKGGQVPGSEMEIMLELYGAKLKSAKYAILSHCWGVPEEGEKEVQFREMSELLTMKDTLRSALRRSTGYMKILDTCKRAQKDDLELVWIDTCCINKESSSELSEAINSMYKWYADSGRCYAYLQDVDTSDINPKWDIKKFPNSNGWPKWFSRGWTLQELVAPSDIHFFNSSWELIGCKKSLVGVLNRITQIPDHVLKEGLHSNRPSVAQIMSWAAHRSTTREEDRAYSLLGLLGVHMPMLYGEGKHAFRRLQLEIMRTSNDQSIFAWGWDTRWTGWSNNFLADDPSFFQDCSHVVTMQRDEFIEALGCNISKEDLLNIPVKRFRSFTVTNGGIQIWLPLTPCEGSSSLFMATLACRYRGEYPITIVLGRSQSDHFRYFGRSPNPNTAKARFEEVFLPYNDDSYQHDELVFKLHCSDFTRQSVFPANIKLTDNALTLSKASDFAVITYKHPKDDTCFAVAFCYCRRKHVTRIICANEDISHGGVVFQRLHLNALEEILSAGRSTASSQERHNSRPVFQHFHLPQSVHGVRKMSTRPESSQGNCIVTLTTVHCPGVCSPCSEVDYEEAPHFFGFMRDPDWNMPSVVYPLNDDSSSPLFVRTDSPEIKLGDYGRLYSTGGRAFQRHGNIFDLATELGMQISVEPAKHKIDPKCCDMLGGIILRSDLIPGQSFSRNATKLSLPDNEDVMIVLQYLSARLAGSFLVTTLVVHSETSWRNITTIPLYTPFNPLPWQEEKCDWTLRKWLNTLRHHFCLLLGWDENNLSTTEENIRFLKDVFGGSHFKEFVGELTFFHRLALMVAAKRSDGACTEPASLCKVVGTCALSDNPSPASPALYSLKDTEAAQDLRAETLVKQLTLIANLDIGTGQYIRERTIWDQALQLKSVPFGVELLRTIGSVYTNLRQDAFWYHRRGRHVRNIDFSEYTIHSLVEEVKELRETLLLPRADSEQRALEEDMTGKILLVCWYGVRLEIKEVLEKVVDRFVDKTLTEERTVRKMALANIGRTFLDVLDDTYDETSSPLLRMMNDAAAGISKYALLVADKTPRSVQFSDSVSHVQEDLAPLIVT